MIRKDILLIGSTLLAVVGGAAFAQTSTFALPSNCTAYLTVQMKSCTVSHHFTCADDPQGRQRRVDLDETGMTYIGTIDAETQWIASFHPMGGYNESLADNPQDPASLTELLATGLDTFDFRTNSPEVGQFHFIGQDRLTGNQVVIDGITLDETEYSIRALDGTGTEMWRSAGREFVSRDWRMFLSGKSTYSTSEESWESDDSPVVFIFPGETGFLSANPKFGCGAVISQLLPLPQDKETNHDHL
ncbi:MAG: hypothetical protein EBT13_10775 [Rhodobacteraceae bacterium]|nr:hypothetical protein [Paracoccaceae bacterium]